MATRHTAIVKVGHWQPQSVDIILTALGFSTLVCISILVVALVHNKTLGYIKLLHRSYPSDTG